MSDFFRQAASKKLADSPSWLSAFQRQQKHAAQALVFPHRKTEDWRYTNLKLLENNDFSAPVSVPENVSDEALADTLIEGLGSIDLVFVNGVLDGRRSDLSNLPEQVSIKRFAEADERERDDIQAMLGKIAGRAVEAKGQGNIFSVLNASQFEQGVYIKVEKDYSFDRAIRILNFTQKQDKGFSVSPRLLVNLEPGAKACVVEHFSSSPSDQNAFTNSVTEINLQANAKLSHYRLHLEDESALHIGGVYADLNKGATIESFYLSLGAKLNRVNVCVNHVGEGAHSELNGVYLPSRQQHVDYHTCIEHMVPHCTSNETFRGIISDSAKAVFNGRIHIHKDAQKTLAQLSNKNLLTSNKAEVDTKPELEIYADDVQCAHGATVSQLNEQSMHYLKTRGISDAEAKVMLSFGFINELVNRIDNDSIAAFLRPKLAELFAQRSDSDDDLTRHLLQ